MEKNLKLFVPPHSFFQDESEPLIFLAGPIQGAEDWQSSAVKILQNNPNLNIANPRREIWEKQWNDQDEYHIQVAWETYHLRMASATGAILFWFPKETTHDCSRAYAQTTRFELAEWLTHLKYRKTINPERELKIFVGIDHDFSGRKYILHRVFQDMPDFRIYTSLENTCKAALDSFSTKMTSPTENKKTTPLPQVLDLQMFNDPGWDRIRKTVFSYEEELKNKKGSARSSVSQILGFLKKIWLFVTRN